jgi:hypothetical protein
LATTEQLPGQLMLSYQRNAAPCTAAGLLLVYCFAPVLLALPLQWTGEGQLNSDYRMLTNGCRLWESVIK